MQFESKSWNKYICVAIKTTKANNEKVIDLIRETGIAHLGHLYHTRKAIENFNSINNEQSFEENPLEIIISDKGVSSTSYAKLVNDPVNEIQECMKRLIV